jgi:hypothetical protein
MTPPTLVPPAAPTNPDNGPIVVDCPKCFRTVWAGTTCRHGEPPPPARKGVVPAAPPNGGPVPTLGRSTNRSRRGYRQ